jgi:hypothetical protein
MRPFEDYEDANRKSQVLDARAPVLVPYVIKSFLQSRTIYRIQMNPIRILWLFFSKILLHLEKCFRILCLLLLKDICRNGEIVKIARIFSCCRQMEIPLWMPSELVNNFIGCLKVK